MKTQVTQEETLDVDLTWQIVRKILRCLFSMCRNVLSQSYGGASRNVTFLLPRRDHHEDIVLKRQKHTFVLPDAC